MFNSRNQNTLRCKDNRCEESINNDLSNSRLKQFECGGKKQSSTKRNNAIRIVQRAEFWEPKMKQFEMGSERMCFCLCSCYPLRCHNCVWRIQRCDETIDIGNLWMQNHQNCSAGTTTSLLGKLWWKKQNMHISNAGQSNQNATHVAMHQSINEWRLAKNKMARRKKKQTTI